jgi:hypothetical protein
MKVGAELGVATAGEIRKAGSVVEGFKGFEVKVGSSGKSWTLKEAGSIARAC